MFNRRRVYRRPVRHSLTKMSRLAVRRGCLARGEGAINHLRWRGYADAVDEVGGHDVD